MAGPGKIHIVAAVAVWLGLCGCQAARAAEDTPLVVTDARLSASPARMKIEMDFDRKPGFTLHYVDAPPRVIIDLPKSVFTKSGQSLPGSGLVKSVRYGTMAEGSARMVVTLAHPAKVTRSESVERGKAGQLVIEAEKTDATSFRALVSGQSWADPQVSGETEQPTPGALPPDGTFVIAVDAGHGGIDTGAVTPDGKVLEKDITLEFARALVTELNGKPGLHAFLIRDKDEFISLSGRVKIARERKANLFISFHADKLKQNDIRGATVYTISDRASDNLSASLAERENLSDELAGIKASDEPEEVADILLDLTRRETQAFSVTFAEQVIQSFKGQVELINNPHRSAGFIVLGSPEIPSILLELGFLSNRKDVAELTDPARRAKIAALLSDAIARYRSPVAAAGGQGG